jgi:hypothetical protein
MTAGIIGSLLGEIRVPTETAVMARPKQTKDKGPSPLRTIGIKASQPWAEWLERFAKHQRTTVASLVDRALAQHAESEGFKDVPPERIP